MNVHTHQKRKRKNTKQKSEWKQKSHVHFMLSIINSIINTEPKQMWYILWRADHDHVVVKAVFSLHSPD